MSLMEAAREAGVYLDTDNMQVFKGESNAAATGSSRTAAIPTRPAPA
jgi:hypothetical protein